VKEIGFALALLAVSPAWADQPVTVLAMGDSTTAGTPGFRSPVEAPPDGAGDEQSQYAHWVRQLHPEWRVLNRGVNGERTDQILRRLPPDLRTLKPQVVVLLAGVNDLYQGRSAEQVEENLERMIRLSLEARARVVVCTILPYNSAPPSVLDRMRRVNRWIRETSSREGLGFCDLFSVVENPARPGTLRGTPDGLHPDVDGYRKMGETIGEELQRVLS